MNVCQHKEQRRAIEMCTDNCKAVASKLEIDLPTVYAWSKELKEMQVQAELNLSFKNVS